MLSRQQLISQIKTLFKARQPLNIAAVKRSHPELIESAYAQIPFLGWRGALEESGIEYSQINVEVLDFVTCKICGREMRALGGLHLERVHGLQPSEYVAEFPGAEMRCEEQRVFKENSKLLAPHWEPFATTEYILDRVSHFHRIGIPVNQRHVLLNEPALVRNTMLLIGSWNEVLSRIGLNPEDVRQRVWNGTYSKEHIIRSLQELEAKGEDLSGVLVRRTSGTSTLYARAVKCFGSYNAALKTAGIDPTRYNFSAQSEKRVELFDQRMKEAIKKPLAHQEAAFKEIRREFKKVIDARYGDSWKRVKEAYGI